MNEALKSLKDRLRRPLPGPPAQLRMMPLPPPPGQKTYVEAGGDCLPGAVLALLYPRNGKTHLVFIRRPQNVVHHKGQIAFPGGHVETGETPAEAAFEKRWRKSASSPPPSASLGP